MANDPVLQRPMFQQGRSTPRMSPSVGLGSMTSPDENAKALRGMFAPTVSLGMPNEMLQRPQQAIDMQPVQSFQEGGFAMPLVAQYDWRNRRYQNPPSYAERTNPAAFAAEQERQRVSEAERRQAIDDADANKSSQPKSQFRRDLESIIPTEEQARNNLDDLARGTAAQRRMLEEADKARSEAIANSPGSPIGDYFRSLTPEEVKARAEARKAAEDKLRAEGARISQTYATDTAALGTPRSGIASLDLSSGMGGGESYSSDPSRSIMSQIQGKKDAPPPPPAREKGILELTLDGIKEDRARLQDEKKQNALLALMQAGFAMAAGRSPNALSNIGAGGQAGVAAFAAMEKGRREELAGLRRDQMAIGMLQAKLADDPDTVKLFKQLGGGDLLKGFDIYNADKYLQAAVSVQKDVTSEPDDKRRATEYIMSRLAKGSSVGTVLPTVRLAPNQ